jgi:hypothetical protein
MPVDHAKYLEDIDPKTLIPYENNATIHDQDVIDESIDTFGYLDVITVDENMVIIGGHGRTKKFLKDGKKIPLVYQVFGLTDEEKIASRHMLNKSTKRAGVDLDKVKADLKILQSMGFEKLTLTGYNKMELNVLIDQTSSALSGSLDRAMISSEERAKNAPAPFKVDPYAKDNWTPDYPLNAPSINIPGQTNQPTDQPGLVYVVMLTFQGRETAERLLDKIGVTERFPPDKRHLHIQADKFAGDGTEWTK